MPLPLWSNTRSDHEPEPVISQLEPVAPTYDSQMVDPPPSTIAQAGLAFDIPEAVEETEIWSPDARLGKVKQCASPTLARTPDVVGPPYSVEGGRPHPLGLFSRLAVKK